LNINSFHFYNTYLTKPYVQVKLQKNREELMKLLFILIFVLRLATLYPDQIGQSELEDINAKYFELKNDFFAYVNLDKILTEYEEAIKAKEQLEKWNNVRITEANNLENEIQALQDEIQNTSAMVSEEKIIEKLGFVQQKLQEYYQYKDKIWGQNGEYEKKESELMQSLYNKIHFIIKSFSEETKLKIVMDESTGTLLGSNSENDITDLILARLKINNEETNGIKNFNIKPNKKVSNIKFGYINSDKVYAECKDAKDAKDKLVKWNKEMETKALTMEKEIQTLEDEIKNMSVMASKEIKDDKISVYQKKCDEYYQFKKKVWSKNGDFYKIDYEIMKPVIDKINESIKYISNEAKYDILLDANTGTILYTKPDYEVTDAIIKKINGSDVTIKDDGNISLKNLKFGYVNLERVHTEYIEEIKVKEQIVKWNKEMEVKVATMEKELNAIDDEIKNMSVMISDEKKNEKKADKQKKLQEFYLFKDKLWGQNGDYYKKNNELMQPLTDKIIQVIKQISEKEKYDFVCDSNTGTILYSEPQFDLTDKILKELNK